MTPPTCPAGARPCVGHPPAAPTKCRKFGREWSKHGATRCIWIDAAGHEFGPGDKPKVPVKGKP
jgi:hypothetical protein